MNIVLVFLVNVETSTEVKRRESRTDVSVQEFVL